MPDKPQPDVEVPESLDFSNLDQYTDEQIAAYNQRVESRLKDNLDEMGTREQEAVNALRSQAQATAQTATVHLDRANDDPLELEVRTRFPPRIEDLHQQYQRIQANGDMATAKAIACEMIAGMVVTEGFDDPMVWRVAASGEDAGMVWLLEAADTILQPVTDRTGGFKRGN